MIVNQVVQYVFFFGLLLIAGYLAWMILAPFLVALALSAAVVTICYPLYERIIRFLPRLNHSVASALTTIIVLVAFIIPIFFVTTVIIGEVTSFYTAITDGEDGAVIESYAADIEVFVQRFIPDFELEISEQIRQSSPWFANNLGTIFANTISFVLLFLVSIVGMFYLFRDGKGFVKMLIKVSPLPDHEDELILNRLAVAVRSVVTGIVLVSVIQGVVAAVGFSIFGIERAILWATIAAILALIPGIGTTFVMAPAVLYLLVTGDIANGVGLLVWALVAIVSIDNFVGPYLMSRGNNLHPFVILMSVLGGIIIFGPIGFIIGPVIVSLFLVLLEIYGHNAILQEVNQSDNENARPKKKRNT